MVVPAPGTLTVLGSSGDKAAGATGERVATKRTAKKAPAKKAATSKTTTASAKKAAAKKATAGGAKKTKGVKRPSR